MTGDSALSAYVEICRGFGLSNDEIRSIHAGGNVPDDVDPRKVVAKALPDDPSAADAHHALLKVLSNSSRGIDAPRDFDASGLGTQLDAVLSAIGGSVTMTDATDEPLSSGGPNPQPWTIEVADPSGNVRELSFSYPPHDAGDSNFPAILASIEASVLDGAPLTFVRLADDARWRFVLVNESNLDSLASKLGDRISFASGPLLAADQIDSFVPDGDHIEEPEAVEAPDEIPQEEEEEAIGNLLTTDESIDDILRSDGEEPDPEPESTSPVDDSLDDVFSSMESDIEKGGEPVETADSPFEPAEPEPTEAAEPAEPAEAVDAEPAEPAEAVDAEPAEPAEPADAEPAEAADAAEAAETTGAEPAASDAVEAEATDAEASTPAGADAEPAEPAGADAEPVDASGSEADAVEDPVDAEPAPADAADAGAAAEGEPVASESSADAEPVESAPTADAEPVESAPTADAEPVESAPTADAEPVESAPTADAEPAEAEPSAETEPAAEAEPVEAEPAADAEPADAEPAEATTGDLFDEETEPAATPAEAAESDTGTGVTDAEPASGDGTASEADPSVAPADGQDDSSSKGVVGRFVGWLKNLF